MSEVYYLYVEASIDIVADQWAALKPLLLAVFKRSLAALFLFEPFFQRSI